MKLLNKSSERYNKEISMTFIFMSKRPHILCRNMFKIV